MNYQGAEQQTTKKSKMSFKTPETECLEEMKKVLQLEKDEDTRLKLAYVTYPKRDFNFHQGEFKDLSAAEEEKCAGNFKFQLKSYKEALMHYNAGILKCPQDTVIGNELYAILMANRSAVFAEMEEYEKALKDIFFIEKMGSYPPQTDYKLSWRKARCFKAIKEFEKANAACEETINMIRENRSLPESQRSDKIEMIEIFLKNKKVTETKPETKSTMLADVENFKGSDKYIGASPLIDITYNEENGRHAVAVKDIPVGTLILKEESYVSILGRCKSTTNCQHCFTSIDRPIPCPTCANVVFCSKACMEIALQSYHGLECPIYECLQECGTNATMVLRIFTQNGFAFFHDQKSKILGYLEEKGNLGLPEKDVYRHDDFDNIMKLFWRDSQYTCFDVFVHCSASFIMHALKLTKFFPFETNKNIILLDEEIFIAKLVVRLCKMANYNVHGLGEIRSLEKSVQLRNGLESHYEMVRIGAGLFPTLAFFNHSCDPSVIRTSLNREILVRTIKPIRAGDIIYDNYGYNYLWTPLEERQKKLEDHYDFICACIPCVEKWPCVEQMQAIIRVPCGNCASINCITMDNPNPSKCIVCRKKLESDDITSITGPIQKLLVEGDDLYRKRKYGESMKIYYVTLELMFKYTNKPDLEMIKVQDLIEICMAHFGNKSTIYK